MLKKIRIAIWFLVGLTGFVALALGDLATRISMAAGNGESGIPVWSLSLTFGFIIGWFSLTIWTFTDKNTVKNEAR